MIINSSIVNMTAHSKKSVMYTEKRETIMKNLDDKTEKKDFKSRLSEDNSGDDSEKNYSLLQLLREYLFSFRKKIMDMLNGNRIHDGYLDLSSGNKYSVWRRTDFVSYRQEEKHEMSFETTGKVVSKDGREIEFNMQLSMSSEFAEEYQDLHTDVVAIMTDPLVINLNSAPISVSDQKWHFDLDADGEEDSISMLNEGAGYLVYDRNKDGVINDGTEMFGAKTGDGFAELAKYDEDGNGWIDENDSIYSKLSVWKKDSAGNDKLLSLKEADVGAIYLANVASEYAIKASLDKQNAQIRKSGMYLTEDGKAKSIQQLDMVKALIS